MNKTQKNKLFKQYAVKTDFYTMPGGEKLGITELSAKARAGYLAVSEQSDEDRINYIIVEGFDDFSQEDSENVAAMSDGVKQGMMIAVLEISDLLASDDTVEAGVEEGKKP